MLSWVQHFRLHMIILLRLRGGNDGRRLSGTGRCIQQISRDKTGDSCAAESTPPLEGWVGDKPLAD